MRYFALSLAAATISVWTIAVPPQPASASGLTALSAELNRINSNLCRKFKSSKCAAQRKSSRTRSTAPVSTTASAKPESAVPLPREKPAELRAKDEQRTAIVLPRQKPADLVKPAAPAPSPSVAVDKVPDAPPPAVVPPDAACLDELAKLKADYQLQPTPVSAGACRVDGALTLRSVETAHGRVMFPEQPLLNCRFAAQFARWVAEQGSVLTAANAGSPLAKVWTGPGYQCRGRNGDASAKVSEHGYGNAVDIENFATADGKRLVVSEALNTASSAQPALAAMRHSACGYFTTVLGPGANSAHASHFHFDLGQHGKSGTYRICE